MTPQTPRTALATGVALILVAACEAGPTNGPEVEAPPAGGDAGDVAGTPVSPPVTDEPAFIRSADDPDLEWGPCPDFMPDGCELAVVQGDPADRNADVFFKLEPGTSVAEHWHTSAERMVLLSGTMEVDYQEQAPVTLTEGTYAYGPAKLPHETHCLGESGDDPCILFIGFEEPVDAVAGAPDEIPHDHEAFIRTTDDSAVEWGPCPDFMPQGCELAVIQGLDEEGYNADVFFKLPPRATVPMHWHTSAERMVLVTGEMRVNYQGQRPVTLDPFTYAYGPAGLPHETRCRDAGECILFIAFEEPVDAIDVRGGDLPHRR